MSVVEIVAGVLVVFVTLWDAFESRGERAWSLYLILKTVPFDDRPEVVAPPPPGSLSRMRVTLHPPFEIPWA